MTPETFDRIALTPALSLLPSRMDSPEARRMIVAICLQESRLTHRRQIRGPARGFPQFEKAGVAGVVRHRAAMGHVAAACEALSYPVDVEAIHAALEHNDVLACIFARLLLWTHPKPLPTTADAAWTYYLDTWRPGKPHSATWAGFYEQAG